MATPESFDHGNTHEDYITGASNLFQLKVAETLGVSEEDWPKWLEKNGEDLRVFLDNDSAVRGLINESRWEEAVAIALDTVELKDL